MSRKMMCPWYRLPLQLMLMSISCALVATSVFASSSIEGIQVYQKNLQPEYQYKQKLADDITRYRNADNLWDALREEFSLSHYEDSPAVQEKIEWFMNNQDYLLRSASRAAPYLYYIMQQVRKRHLPAELVLLPIIESGYNPFSLSNMGAAGIWQLMPSTASGLGVKQDWWYDGRRDVIASTHAALNYLAYLQTFFAGRWLLAIAAYNTGEGNVLSAIKRNIRDGRDTDFWSLPVAQQTRDYVPSLLALATIISHPEQYPIYFPPVRNAPYLAQIDVGSQINLKYAATLAGISYKKLLQLNPGFNQPATSTNGPSKLILPIENVEQFSENLTHSPTITQQLNWIHYRMKSGDTLASVARKFATTTVAIRKLNHLDKNIVPHGSNLLIPTQNDAGMPAIESAIDVAYRSENKKNKYLKVKREEISSQPLTKYTLQPGDTIYMVRSKDTLDSIARRFHIGRKMLQMANSLRSAAVPPGKQLIIPTHSITMDAPSTLVTANRVEPGDTIYMVRSGDTLEKVADKFRTTPSAIRLANLMERNSLKEGERLVIPTHMRG